MTGYLLRELLLRPPPPPPLPLRAGPETQNRTPESPPGERKEAEGETMTIHRVSNYRIAHKKRELERKFPPPILPILHFLPLAPTLFFGLSFFLLLPPPLLSLSVTPSASLLSFTFFLSTPLYLLTIILPIFLPLPFSSPFPSSFLSLPPSIPSPPLPPAPSSLLPSLVPPPHNFRKGTKFPLPLSFVWFPLWVLVVFFLVVCFFLFWVCCPFLRREGDE